jgi:DNA-directed RNA polymerase sigma subunit (sigma70/sigma32)
MKIKGEIYSLITDDILPLMNERLTQRECKVLKLLFGLDGNEKHTLRECGIKIGSHYSSESISGNRVMQIRDKAIRKLIRNLKGDIQDEN